MNITMKTIIFYLQRQIKSYKIINQIKVAQNYFKKKTEINGESDFFNSIE